MTSNIICSRFYEAYNLIRKNNASTKYQVKRWKPKPLKSLKKINTEFYFDCYGMFFSWIFRDKLEYIKDELLKLWSIEAENHNYINKYGDLLWFAYLLATKNQKYILIKKVFNTWNNNYRNGNINFIENTLCYLQKNVSNEIKKGSILLWCNKYENKKNQKYGHIIICLEKPIYISCYTFILKCGETTINNSFNGLQIKYRYFYHKNSDIYHNNKLVIIGNLK